MRKTHYVKIPIDTQLSMLLKCVHIDPTKLNSDISLEYLIFTGFICLVERNFDDAARK